MGIPGQYNKMTAKNMHSFKKEDREKDYFEDINSVHMCGKGHNLIKPLLMQSLC